jgi:DNA-binding NtrC family response regulator
VAPASHAIATACPGIALLPIADHPPGPPASFGRAGPPSPRPAMPSLPARPPTALIVQADTTLREHCAIVASSTGYEPLAVARADQAELLLRRHAFDLLILDIPPAEEDKGLDLLRSCSDRAPVSLVIMAGEATVNPMIQGFRVRAWDWLPQPFTPAQLRLVIERARARLSQPAGLGDPVGHTAHVPARPGAPLPLGSSPAFLKTLHRADRVAGTDASVFLSGESGSGKELLARYIHARSGRAARPMVAVNCAALPEALLESELFGHVRGAFTGALRDKAGLLETADHGTFFLDDVTEMAQSVQAKLLRFIQDGLIRRVGSAHVQARVDVRFIAATNRDPREAVRDGTLRKDLYYRLSVVPLPVPSLRERVDDIPVLAEYFLERYWLKHRSGDSRMPVLGGKAIEALREHGWPGNVRQLENAMEHAVVLLRPGQLVTRADLPSLTEPTAARPTRSRARGRLATELEGEYHISRDRVLADFELRYLRSLVDRTGANLSHAAKLAGVNRTTIYRLMDKHGLRDIIVEVGERTRLRATAVAED